MKLTSSVRHFLEDPPRSVTNMQYRLRESWRRQTSRINPQPILVFGNQKSGTSAIAALLGETTDLSYTIDIFCRYIGLEERLFLRVASLEELLTKGLYYFSKDIVKDPSFIFFYDEFLDRFPDSQRVFVIRDPRQNIRSILNRLRLPGNVENLSSEHWQFIQKQFPNWYIVLDGGLAGHKGKTYIETLALRWRRVFQIYLKHQTELILIQYETFNQDKVKSIHELASKIGLQAIRNIDHIKDVQFQPKGNPKVELEDFFGTDNLKRIEDICGEEMIALGYRI